METHHRDWRSQKVGSKEQLSQTEYDKSTKTYPYPKQ